MKSIFKIRNLAAFLAAVMLVAVCGCGKRQDDTNSPSASIGVSEPTELPALTPQPEVQDKGETVEYTVSGTISSKMVVQRNSYFNVFGWSENKGGVIYAEFMGEKRYGIIDEDGNWRIQFSPHEATAEAQNLKIYPTNGKTTEFDNILVGDVWIVSGQSNAELTLSNTLQKNPEYKDKIDKNDNIRLFTQTREYVMSVNGKLDLTKPQENIVNKSWKWNYASAGAASQFSAIGYYFAKELSQTVDVPLGIVMAAAGGAVLHELMPSNVADEFGFTSAPSVPVCGFYNSLIYPFTKNAITGMIFYQGESECGSDQYKTYTRNLKRTVEEYRNVWGSNFPFINVQLSTHLGDSFTYWPQLPQIRAAQYDAYKNIPNSYIVTAMDQAFQKGDPDWAHPCYKLELGRRAASIAAAIVYEKADINYSLCPEPDKITWEKDCVIIDFKYVGDGIKLLEGDKPVGFDAYNKDGKKITDTVELVDSDTIKITTTEAAVSVSYGMFGNAAPSKANAANSVGYALPAFEIRK